MLGEVDTTIVVLMEAAKTFIALYGQRPGIRLIIFTKKKKRPKIQALLPTSSNRFVHGWRTHL